MSEMTEQAVKRLGDSTTWSHGQVRWLIREAEREELPDPVAVAEACIRSGTAGMGLTPGMIAQVRREMERE